MLLVSSCFWTGSGADLDLKLVLDQIWTGSGPDLGRFWTSSCLVDLNINPNLERDHMGAVSSTLFDSRRHNHSQYSNPELCRSKIFVSHSEEVIGGDEALEVRSSD